MSIANNLETLRYFKSKLVFLAEIAHKTNRPELALSVTVQGGRRTIAKKGHQNLIN